MSHNQTFHNIISCYGYVVPCDKEIITLKKSTQENLEILSKPKWTIERHRNSICICTQENQYLSVDGEHNLCFRNTKNHSCVFRLEEGDDKGYILLRDYFGKNEFFF